MSSQAAYFDSHNHDCWLNRKNFTQPLVPCLFCRASRRPPHSASLSGRAKEQDAPRTSSDARSLCNHNNALHQDASTSDWWQLKSTVSLRSTDSINLSFIAAASQSSCLIKLSINISGTTINCSFQCIECVESLRKPSSSGSLPVNTFDGPLSVDFLKKAKWQLTSSKTPSALSIIITVIYCTEHEAQGNLIIFVVLSECSVNEFMGKM